MAGSRANASFARPVGARALHVARALLAAALLALAPGAFAAIAPAIAAGDIHTCTLDTSGQARCWGENRSGVLGSGDDLMSDVPAQVVGLSNPVVIAGGTYHTCAVTSDSSVMCWGENGVGELNSGNDANSSIAVPALSATYGVTALAAGGGHTCVLFYGSFVSCWGLQPAAGDYTTDWSAATAVATGEHHTCIIAPGGGVQCWGQNDHGQLGNGTTVDSSSAVNVTLPGPAIALSARSDHTCAILGGGAVYCWGHDDFGQLGNAATTDSTVPVKVAGLAGAAIAIATGDQHTCAVETDGRVQCWGINDVGQLGNAATTNSLTPVFVSGIASAVDISAGENHTCVLTSIGDMWCWGDNGHGQLSNASTGGYNTTPVGVAGSISSIGTGGYHSCAVTVAGDGFCWGDDRNTQLGNGRAVSVATPVAVAGLPSAATQLTTGMAHTCVILGTGAAYCWGEGGQGQLGAGDYSPSVTPVAVLGGNTFTAIASGFYHTCGVTSAGAALCWGDNDFGELGDGTLVASYTPVPVAGLGSGIKAVAAEFYDSCALDTAGGVHCWGRNDNGQLGNGTTITSRTPVAVSGLASGVSSIALGAYFACAVQSGNVMCWGFNPDGRVGDGTTTDRSTPVRVTGLSNVVAITAGQFHACALTSSGSVYCWGNNTRGQLGNDTVSSSATPMQVAALPPGINAIAGGKFHTCAKTTGGVVYCWGGNSGGALGNGTFADQIVSSVTVRDGGAGTIATNDWFLDLDPASAESIPVTKIPPYLLAAQGNASTAVVDVKASVQFRAQDAGHPIFVYGYAPASVLKGAALRMKDSGGCVLVQLNASGQPQQVSASQLGAYTNNVTSSASQTVNLLNNVLANNVAGSTFCVGTGTDGSQSLDVSNSRCAATIPGGSTTCLPPTQPSASAPVNPVVSLAGPANSMQGTSVTFTATVVGSNPGGTVQFADGGASLGGAVALANGVATFSSASLAPGLHSITAAYSGDAGNSAANSNTVSHQVMTGAILTLTADRNPSVLGAAVTFTATVTGNAPTGTITFSEGGTVLGTASLAAGQASLTLSSLSVGAHSISAAYSGDGQNAATTSGVTVQVNGPIVVQLLTTALAALDFGAESMNTTTGTRSVTLTNTSAGTVTVTGVTTTAGFAIASSTCANAVLAPGASCIVALTFTPNADGSVVGSLVVAYAGGGPTYIALNGIGEKSLVTHYYQAILRRDPDAPGKSFWSGEATRMQSLGANVNEAWYAMAMAFFTSAEYVGFQRDDTGFVADLYNTFFNRPPDAGGSSYWVGQIGAGMPREVVLASFMFSSEFQSFTQGIFGASSARAEANVVTDFYRGLLGRLPESTGFTYWLQQFRTAQCQGPGQVYAQVDSISGAFLNSAEYAARARMNAQYVGDLYNAFLRRGGDLAGVQYWINQLASGAQTREQLRQAFIASPEFQARVQAVVAQGCLH